VDDGANQYDPKDDGKSAILNSALPVRDPYLVTVTVNEMALPLLHEPVGGIILTSMSNMPLYCRTNPFHEVALAK
jgi:hypothetical protein